MLCLVSIDEPAVQRSFRLCLRVCESAGGGSYKSDIAFVTFTGKHELEHTMGARRALIASSCRYGPRSLGLTSEGENRGRVYFELGGLQIRYNLLEDAVHLGY